MMSPGPGGPIATAKALYDYDGLTDDELSFREGDVLSIEEKDTSGWWKASIGAKNGWIPANYVQETVAASATQQPPLTNSTPPPVGATTPTTPISSAKALYDYDGLTDDELSFRKGDELSILSKHATGWWEASLGVLRGWIPANYVQET
eukprot:CAMPEP_0174259198 /NCGR_PEP_ID=MMETSP0439-20130205/8061_1 /TAXON_ID=0 /ORGANISM="Stereomyxa ramosa, Strain Chinc5" /LENGTH=148 /DNA_ID=CAMNT_0015342993 /DNA_START=31 /DNA_END=477 /DNA_ORIENTATION=-